jgi:superfamily II DNA or RNA helicase
VTLSLFDKSVFFAGPPPKLRPYQTKAIQTLRNRVREGKKRILLVSPTRCHAKGQGILMYDGSIRAVEDIRDGDMLMGPDSAPREVLALSRGRGRMYRIVPVKGEPWTVNEDHVLTLVRTNADRQPHRNGELVDVTVREWLAWPKWRRHIHKLYRAPVEFSTRSLLPISPYLLGVWLGDGWMNSGKLGIAVGSDIDLEQAVIFEARAAGLETRIDVTRGKTNRVRYLVGSSSGPGCNVARNALRSLGLFGALSGTKFIPRLYLTASREDRLEILAGLLDTDGSLSGKVYDFISKSRQLANDLVFVARSVGLAAYVHECRKGCQTGAVGTYWRVNISGETSIVPCRVPRKRASKRGSKINVLRTGFSVEPADDDDFYGFTLDGDSRYLLDDFTVTHNSGKMVLIASIIQTSSVPALFVAHRMELIDQAVDQLGRLGITNVGVMRGDDDRADPGASVQVASIQTLARRKKPVAGIVLVDECHRAAADSYQDLFEHYRDSIILGFTATPGRYDGRPLGGGLFEVLEVVTTYAELIKQGFIVAPECYSALEAPDLTGIRVIGGDYDEGALGEVMRKQSLVGNLLDHWLKLAHMYPKPDGSIGLVEGPRRRTFIFAVDIRHSTDICEKFSKAGVKIAHLDGTTPEGERRRIIKALGEGELEAVSNCNILLEGVDIPSAKCVVHARPTQSLVLWRQSSSRILTPWHPGCPSGCVQHPNLSPLLLDHAQNIDRHGFPHEDLHWTLTDKARRVDRKVPTRICKSCFAYLPASRVLCPYCGAEAPPAPAQPPPNETQEQLVRRSTTPEDMQRKFYDDVVRLARQKGNKPGFASFKFKEHYGSWPPWDWSEETKASFASDPEWQAALEAKEARKAKRKEAEEVAASEPVEVEVPENDANEELPPEEDDSFGSWVKDQGIE